MLRLNKYNTVEYFVTEVTPEDYWTHARCESEEEANNKLVELKKDLHKVKDWAIIKREITVTQV